MSATLPGWPEGLEIAPPPSHRGARIVGIRIGNIGIDPHGVEYEITIRQGREAVHSGGTASTLSLRLIGYERRYMQGFEVGLPIDVWADDAQRCFQGTITDAELEHDRWDQPSSLSLIAVGALAELGGRTTELQPWPDAPWFYQVNWVLDLAGIPEARRVIIAPVPDYWCHRRSDLDAPLEPEDSLGALDGYAAAVGAAVYDLPDGRIVVQALGSRFQMPVIEPDPADVEFAPGWRQALEVVNRVAAEWGTANAAHGRITLEDAGSRFRYGLRDVGVITDLLATEADARRRVLEFLERNAFPRWTLPGVTLLNRYPLQVGARLVLQNLPSSAPLPSWSPVVEGWEDVITPDGWTQVVTLSDPVLSGVALAWAGLPPYRWFHLRNIARWRDATSLANLFYIAEQEDDAAPAPAFSLSLPGRGDDA